MAYAVNREENSAEHRRDRIPDYDGPSISAAHRRSYAENDPRGDFWNWVARNRLLFKIGIVAISVVAFMMFWFASS